MAGLLYRPGDSEKLQPIKDQVGGFQIGDILRSQTWQPYVPLFSVALVYLIMVVGLTRLLGVLERRLRRSDYR